MINFKVLSVVALAVLSLSSCLKDPRFINFADSPPLVEFPLAAYNSNKTTVVGATSPYVISVATQATTNAGIFNLPVTVNLASANVLTTATTFTVVVDNSTLMAAAPSATKPSAVTPSPLTANIATYYPLPAADYTITGLSGTIPAGQRTATINVAINTTLVGSTFKNYALRLVITSASQQISSYYVQLYNFQFTP